MLDAFAVGFMNQGLTPSIWVTISLGLGVFLGGNLIIACIISAVLPASASRSSGGSSAVACRARGGEYIYNSRIVHPVFGIAQSFGDAAIWLMWIYVLAPLAVDPGPDDHVHLPRLDRGRRLDRELATGSPSSSRRIFNIIGFLFVVFGIKIFALTQKIVMFFGIGGASSSASCFTFTSQGHLHREVERGRAAERFATSTRQFIVKVGEAAGTAIPTTWNWSDTFGVMVAMSWLFAYAYSISFIGGEVKRPDKTHHLGQPVRDPGAVRLHALDRGRAAYSRWATSSSAPAPGTTTTAPIEGFNMPYGYGSNFIDLAVYIDRHAASGPSWSPR